MRSAKWQLVPFWTPAHLFSQLSPYAVASAGDENNLSFEGLRLFGQEKSEHEGDVADQDLEQLKRKQVLVTENSLN